MSEETPPLRLKSRLRPETPASGLPPSAPAAEPAAEGSSASPGAPGAVPPPETGVPRERTKPKLSLSGTTSAPPPPEPAAPEPAAADGGAGASEPLVNPPAAEEPPPASPRPPPPGTPPPPTHAPHTPGIYLSASRAQAGKSQVPRPIHLHLEGAEPSEAPPASIAVKPEEKPAFKYGVVLVFFLALTVIGGGAFLIVRFLRDVTVVPASTPVQAGSARPASAAHPGATSPSTPVATAPAASPQAGATTPPATTEAPVSPMGQALAKARAVTGLAEDEKASVEGILATSPTGPTSPPATAATEPPPESRHEQPSRGVVVVDSVAANPEYIAFVEATRISGVFQGDPPRALINGRTLRAGTLVDANLGIYFHGLDSERRQIVFRDARGVLIRKGY